MGYKVTFKHKDRVKGFPVIHYIFDTSDQAEQYAEDRMSRWKEYSDYQVDEIKAKPTHIFADGRIHTIHDNVEAWQAILADGS